MTIIFDEYLEIDGVALATHAYWIESLAPLFTMQKRGVTEAMPYQAGGISYRRRSTFVTVSLRLNVIGEVDVDGNPITDPRDGLYDHLEYLDDNLLADVVSTRSATWHLPDGVSTRTAEVNVEAFTVVGNTPVSAACTLELSIPAGRFEAVGS